MGFKQGHIDPNPEEDAWITEQARKDGTLLSDEELAEFRPIQDFPELQYLVDASIKRRGKQKAPTKEAVSIRLSPEVLAHFRAMGKGWQRRIDEVLKEYISR